MAEVSGKVETLTQSLEALQTDLKETIESAISGKVGTAENLAVTDDAELKLKIKTVIKDKQPASLDELSSHVQAMSQEP
jgi:hypothetical protein